MKKKAQELGPIIRKTRVMMPDNPVDTAIDDMATASKDRILSEVEKKKVVPNTLAEQIRKALG